ncbi:hypothetical protein MSPP1_003231 [Malassezia sp. CBS 17886]|nr:hypothetical protein MSPP1_003231 [Malassezia sp. CBS 17886]
MRLRRWSWRVVLAALTLAAAAPRPAAAEKASNPVATVPHLRTVATAYCSQPGPVLVSALALTYYPQNSSLYFDISVAALANDARLTASLHVYAYGRNMLDMTLDLCALDGGSLCPIPVYNFTGGGVFHVPPEYSSQVPSIAYKVPDLEALGVLSLYDRRSNTTIGCMQVTLENGLTVRTPGVTWGPAGFLIAAVVAAAVYSLWPGALSALQWRVIDLLAALQHIVFVAMLTLVVPKVFYEFAQNMGWAVGLIYMTPVQRSIYATRIRHGSDDQHIFYGALQTAQYSRLANLYPAAVINPASAPLVAPIRLFSHAARSVAAGAHVLAAAALALAKRKLYAPNTGPGGEMTSGGNTETVVWAAGNPGFTQTGIFYYAEGLDISPYSLFLTVLINWLFVVCIGVAVVCVGVVLVYVLGGARGRGAGRGREQEGRREGDAHSASCSPEHSSATATPSLHTPGLDSPPPRRRSPAAPIAPIALRILEAATPPLLVAMFFQWAHSNAWPSHVSAAFVLAALVAAWAAFLVPMFVYVRRAGGADTLYYSADRSPWDSTSAAATRGVVVHRWRPRYYWFSTVLLLCTFLRACFVAFPQTHNYAMRQSVGLLVVDVLLCLVLLVLRPARGALDNAALIVPALFRIASWAICIALTTEANIWGIPRAVLGFVLMALTALPIVFLFFLFLWENLAALVSRRHWWGGTWRGTRRPVSSDFVSEKGDEFGSQSAWPSPHDADDVRKWSRDGPRWGESEGEGGVGRDAPLQRAGTGGGDLLPTESGQDESQFMKPATLVRAGAPFPAGDPPTPVTALPPRPTADASPPLPPLPPASPTPSSSAASLYSAT